MDDLKMELFEEGEAFHHQSQLKGSHIQNGTYGTLNYQNYQTYETFELYEVKQETNGTKEVNPDDETDEDEEFDIDGFIDDFLSDYVENFLEIILYDYIVESIHENYENHMLDLIADENAELEENRLVQNGHGGGHGGQQHHGHGQYSSRIQ